MNNRITKLTQGGVIFIGACLLVHAIEPNGHHAELNINRFHVHQESYHPPNLNTSDTVTMTTSYSTTTTTTA